jgi:hypothetical protein
MLYTPAMGRERFERLAEELAGRDVDLVDPLARARRAAEHLRALALDRVDAFRNAARERGAAHLTDVEVGPVGTDEKHVDGVSFGAWRGRLRIVCVAKCDGEVRLVGPFKRGGPEKPCADHPLEGPEVEAALEDLLHDLIESGSGV